MNVSPSRLGPRNPDRSPVNQYGSGNGVIVRTENEGSNFVNPTFITFPVVGSSGVSHPHETVQFENELFVPDLVSLK